MCTKIRFRSDAIRHKKLESDRRIAVYVVINTNNGKPLPKTEEKRHERGSKQISGRRRPAARISPHYHNYSFNLHKRVSARAPPAPPPAPATARRSR
ncbi:hypothetical protein EVAR_61830_1 [Eumeta japonica]|uniref:Uncharacterized protein n=1 Tax=Eumeta variegata TaxID=151549 RepID=A0A4C1YYJ1_EUMVA|nr:hypothetical protein EVAR_61830_1 [Eumeta japonica]